eukprot:2525627-Alexandrium_andersonii.AAC.1
MPEANLHFAHGGLRTEADCSAGALAGVGRIPDCIAGALQCKDASIMQRLQNNTLPPASIWH